MQKRHVYKANKEASLSSKAGIKPSCDASPVLSGSASGSVHGSVLGPEDSVSQAPGPSKASPCDMSAFFKGFASYLGLPDGGTVSFPAMLSEMVAREVESRLASNPPSLPAPSCPSDHSAVQSATIPLPGLGVRQSVESLQANVPIGGIRGRLRPGNDAGLDQAPSSCAPSTGKRF